MMLVECAELRQIGGLWRFKNTYELLNLSALKISTLYENRIFQCMGNLWNSTQNILPIHWKMCVPPWGEICSINLDCIRLFGINFVLLWSRLPTNNVSQRMNIDLNHVYNRNWYIDFSHCGLTSYKCILWSLVCLLMAKYRLVLGYLQAQGWQNSGSVNIGDTLLKGYTWQFPQ